MKIYTRQAVKSNEITKVLSINTLIYTELQENELPVTIFHLSI